VRVELKIMIYTSIAYHKVKCGRWSLARNPVIYSIKVFGVLQSLRREWYWLW